MFTFAGLPLLGRVSFGVRGANLPSDPLQRNVRFRSN
jgi:hypothetical protein